MSKFLLLSSMLLCLAVVSACGKPKEPKIEADPSASANFLSEQKKQLDQAKQVGQELQKAADAQREVIELNTNGAAKKPAKKAGE